MATSKSTLLYGEEAGDKPSPKAMDEFVTKLLDAVTIIHKAHLVTTGKGSFAGHTGLGVYSDLDDATDSLAEIWMGCTGQGLSFGGISTSNFSKEVRTIYEWIENNRSKVGTESHLQNEVDSILSTLSKALFKLDRLQ